MATIILEIEADPSGLAPAASAIKQLGKQADDLYQKLQHAADGFKQMAQATGAITTTAEAQKKANKSIDDFSKSLGGINKALAEGTIAEFTQQILTFTTGIVEASAQVGAFNGQITTMLGLVSQMKDAGVPFSGLKDQIEKTKDKVEDTTEALAKASTVIEGLEHGKKGLESVKDILDAAKDSAEGFGLNTEYLSKGISVLNGAIGFLNTVMKIQSLLYKETNDASAKQAVNFKAGAKEAASTATNTTLASGAFKGFSGAVAMTKNAFNALKGAIISTGIGALLVLLGSAVSAVMDWMDSTKEEAEAQEKLSKEIDRTTDSMNRQNQVLDLQNRQMISAAENALKLAKAKGDKKEIAQKEKILFEVNQKALDDSLNQTKLNIQKQAKLLGINVPADIDANTITTKIKLINIKLDELKSKKDALGDSKEDKVLAAKYDNQIKVYDNLSKGYSTYADQTIQKNTLITNNTVDNINKEIKAKEDAVKEDQRRQEETKKRLENELKAKETHTKALLAGVKKGSDEEYKIKTDGLNSQIAFYKANYGKMQMTLDDQLAAVKDLQDEIDSLTEEHTKNRLEKEIDDLNRANDILILATEDGSKAQLEAKLKKLEDEKKYYEQHKDELVKLDDDYTLKVAQNAHDIAALKNSILEKDKIAAEQELKDKEAINKVVFAGIKTREQIEKDYLEAKKTNEKLTLEQFLKDDLEHAAKRTAIEESLFKSHTELNAEYNKAVAEGYIGDYDQYIQYLQAKKDAHHEAQEQMKDAALELGTETINTIMEISNQNRQARHDAEMADLQKKKETELADKNLTEAQKEAINKKYADKEKALKKKQWEDDKKAKVNQAIIQGLMATATFMANNSPLITLAVPPYALPNPAYYIGLGMVAASTSLNVAKIASQPAPQFAKGTRNAPPGFKWVGEEGPELINTPGGHAIITAPESAQLSAIFDKYNLPGMQVPLFKAASVSNMLNYQSDKTGGAAIDYDEMGRSIARHLPEGTKVNIHMDKDGVHAYVVRSNSRVNYNNNKFRFN